MSHCTNINHPQIQDWAKKFNVEPEYIGAIVSLWQETSNDLEKLPSNKYILDQILKKKKGKIEVKQGVDDIFKSNSELSKIGTQEQYSEYLDTIFPDSKIKEIDNSLYISVLNDLKVNKIIDKQC